MSIRLNFQRLRSPDLFGHQTERNHVPTYTSQTLLSYTAVGAVPYSAPRFMYVASPRAQDIIGLPQKHLPTYNNGGKS